MNLLLFGGTSETKGAAEALASAGHRVLVSTATDAPLETGTAAAITCRHGRMNREEMAALIATVGIHAVVDVSHPYAIELHATAADAARESDVPYFRLDRPGVGHDLAEVAPDHAAAAQLAFSHGRPVLLTTGSRNLGDYAEAARKTGLPWFARVLDHPDSHAACAAVGMSPGQIIFGRGPFSIDGNRAVIRAHGIGVLVTKDSGQAGGVSEKIEAARLENCRVVIVDRPAGAATAFASITEILSVLSLHQSAA